MRAFGGSLLALAVAAIVPAAEPDAAPRARLQEGITQYVKGDHALALTMFEDAIRAFTPEPARYQRELTQAYLYRGAALVGLGLDQKARGSFAAALHHAAHLRLGERDFPPRVVAVFEDARTSETPAVFLPARAEGRGIRGLVLAGGAVAAGGGVAAVALSGGEEPAQPPLFTFVSSVPAPGASVTVPASRALSLSMTVMLYHATTIDRDGELLASLVSDSGQRCASLTLSNLYAAPDRETRLDLGGFQFSDAAACGLPWTSARLALRLSRPALGQLLHEQDVPLSFTFVR